MGRIIKGVCMYVYIYVCVHHAPMNVRIVIYVCYVCMEVSVDQGRALRVGKVGSAYLKQNNQVPHFPSGVQLGT